MTSLNPEHPMSQLATENAMKFLMLAIWKLRRHLPNLQIEITEEDMASLSLARRSRPNSSAPIST